MKHEIQNVKLDEIFLSITDILGSDSSGPADETQRPNSWMYNFVEVSGHNLDSQT